MNPSAAQVQQQTVCVGTEPTRYGGFWIRTVAFIIDSVIISIPTTLIGFPLMGYAFFRLLPYLDEYEQTQMVSSEMASALFLCWGIALLLQVVGLVIFWLYYALLESSAKQATWGKQIFGLRVTDADGRRLSFARATGRTFAKLISYAILYIGFMMAGWTKQKRALHDFIAGTLVVKN